MTVANDLIDPRIAAVGGTRTNAKSAYGFPGMVERGNWRKTRVHRHTHFYGCAQCGQRFADPHAVYAHLAKRHASARGGLGRAEGSQTPRQRAGRAR
jgi:hypothetical protein